MQPDFFLALAGASSVLTPAYQKDFPSAIIPLKFFFQRGGRAHPLTVLTGGKVWVNNMELIIPPKKFLGLVTVMLAIQQVTRSNTSLLPLLFIAIIETFLSAVFLWQQACQQLQKPHQTQYSLPSSFRHLCFRREALFMPPDIFSLTRIRTLRFPGGWISRWKGSWLVGCPSHRGLLQRGHRHKRFNGSNRRLSHPALHRARQEPTTPTRSVCLEPASWSGLDLSLDPWAY